MTIGSVFSGIDGLALGLERAGLGPTLWQVEISAECRAVLARHWPEAERHDDVRTLDTTRLAPVDIICGGFPCQDISSAGKRAGLGGARSGLWSEFRRVVEAMRPRWVVVENVASGALNWVDAIRGDLEQLGYETLPIPIAASDVGAWHRRARVFVIAHIDGAELRATEGRSQPGGVAADAQGIGRARTGARTERAGRSVAERGAVADADDQRGPSIGWRPELGPAHWPEWNPWTAEPDVARVVHGLPGRVDRERALGNSVVPQCAEVIGWIIRHLDHSHPRKDDR